MGRHRSINIDVDLQQPATFVLRKTAWEKIVKTLQFSVQQSQIVALILRGMCDKEIAIEMNIRVATVRTHLRKVFERANVENRVGLVLRVISLAELDCAEASYHQN